MPDQTAVVVLSVPRRGSFLRMVRLTAAAMAAQGGFDIDEVEDIRVAVTEMALTVVDASDTATDTLDLRLEVGGEELKVTVTCAAESAPDEVPALSVQILDVLAVSHSYDVEGDCRVFEAVFAR